MSMHGAMLSRALAFNNSRAAPCIISKRAWSHTWIGSFSESLLFMYRKLGKDWRAVLAADLRMVDEAEARYLTLDRGVKDPHNGV